MYVCTPYVCTYIHSDDSPAGQGVRHQANRLPGPPRPIFPHSDLTPPSPPHRLPWLSSFSCVSYSLSRHVHPDPSDGRLGVRLVCLESSLSGPFTLLLCCVVLVCPTLCPRSPPTLADTHCLSQRRLGSESDPPSSVEHCGPHPRRYTPLPLLEEGNFLWGYNIKPPAGRPIPVVPPSSLRHERTESVVTAPKIWLPQILTLVSQLLPHQRPPRQPPRHPPRQRRPSPTRMPRDDSPPPPPPPPPNSPVQR